MDTGFNLALPQAGMDVTARAGTEEDPAYGNNTIVVNECSKSPELGPEGNLDPILVDYSLTDLCPVNVHWHLGAEHRSEGQYDEEGSSPVGRAGTPANVNPNTGGRRLEEVDAD